MIAVIAGGAMYYLQVYAFYEDVAPMTEIELTAYTGDIEPVAIDGFTGIDSESSPVRYRSCFDMSLSIATLTETYVAAEDAVPLVAPGWFDCFDASQLGEDLENGTAFAFLGTENIEYGIDRIIAVYPDGRAFAWTQINACGEVVFDGDPTPDGCPERPE